MDDARELFESLRSLGVRQGDTLMLHASMRRLRRPAELLLDALEVAVGPEGCLVMLVCAPVGPFDPAHSPAWAELGVLSEVFRRRRGVVLNEHPVARMGAWGARAADLVREAPLDDYYGPGSPLERLVQARGKVLRLGADPETVTLFHYAEYIAAVPNKRRRSWSVDVLGLRGVEAVRGSCLDDEHGIREWAGDRDYFAQILLEYLSTERPRVGRIGEAHAELLDAEDATRFAVRWLETSFGEQA